MDVYLDESVKHGLRVHRLMGGHTVSTAVYMKWAGLPNGEWMKLAHEAGFQVVVTNRSKYPPAAELDALQIRNRRSVENKLRGNR